MLLAPTFHWASPGYTTLDAPRPNRDNTITSARVEEMIINSSNFTSHYTTPIFQPTTFELLIRCLKTSLTSFVYIIVYRSSHQPITSKFIAFSFCMKTSLFTIPRLLSNSDFNLHVDDSDTLHTTNFIELLNAFGLCQHVRELMLVSKHTLDLVVTAEAAGLA